MLRRFAEYLSRERVLKRRLPDRFGGPTIFVSPDSALAFWRRNLESLGADLFAFADRFVSPGDVVWDVGANVGLFSFAAAHRAGPRGRVLALEPDVFSVGLLRRTADELRNAAPVDVFPVAVCDRMEMLEFCVAQRGRASNHLDLVDGNSQAGGTRSLVHVPAVSLDWLLDRRPPPNVLKIDVEGAETIVLDGADELLTEVRPVILCEVGAKNSARVTEQLDAAGYRLFDWEALGKGHGEGHPLERAPFATLALPDEDTGKWFPT